MKLNNPTKVLLVCICFALFIVGFMIRLPSAFRYIDKELHVVFYFFAAALLNILFANRKIMWHILIFIVLYLFGIAIEYAQEYSNKFFHKRIHGRYDVEDVRANLKGLVLFSILWFIYIAILFVYNKLKFRKVENSGNKFITPVQQPAGVPLKTKPLHMAHIRHELLIGAPAEIVYNAITSGEGLAAWWTPNTKAKPESGSIARFSFGDGYFKEMKIAELKPYEAVKWICITGAGEWVGTTISFQLQSGDKETLLNSHPEMKDQVQQQRGGDNATLLIFHHDNWKEYTPMFAECNYTWGQFLRSLKLFCETGRGCPWPDQHRS